MRLTQHTDYAIRVLMFAASRFTREGPEALSSIREIAEAYGISENHLMKVVNRLAQEGLLHTQRGRHGGLRLARAPHETRLGEVVRLIEDDMALVECFGSGSTCPLTAGCHLATALIEARQAFVDSLDRHTLADLVPRARARAIIALSARPPRAAPGP
ncbi:MAG: Rrf2 family transcriptional regulator [Piscinibacter sp.]|uniref:RrF2 family transcriptional regulator n=1 Tax=Piscinibacter TaxID=1114981 RepID=UPI000FDEBC1A|nr:MULTISPECIES: Rrf2 family transcriptional regulator [Piscinibacter]MCW5665254.1 Rrf2 family transcriptional regulator [Piscinibacter sp.]